MDAEKEIKMFRLAKVRAFDNHLVNMKIETAALVAIYAGVTREGFIAAAADYFDRTKRSQMEDAADHFNAMVKAEEAEERERSGLASGETRP